MLRWVGIITILGLALSACAPSTSSTGTPGASTTGTASGETTQAPGGSTTGTPGGSTSSTGTVAATTESTTAATTAATTAPTTAATMAATTASTAAATATTGGNVGSGGSSGALTVNEAQTPSGTQLYILVDGKGMTLYENGKDTANTSTCDASCLANWPPLLASGSVTAGTGLNSSDFGTTQTTDGKTMVTYRGFPLYYFKGDQNPGDMKGYGVGGLWTVVAVPAPQSGSGQGTATPTP